MLPYQTFNGANRSYFIGFTNAYYEGYYGRVSCGGHPTSASRALMSDIETRCDHLGLNLSAGAAIRPTEQLLAVSGFNCGQDFVYTDLRDSNDPLQNCIANITGFHGGQATPPTNAASRPLYPASALGMVAVAAAWLA